jgi:hypothetical protein
MDAVNSGQKNVGRASRWVRRENGRRRQDTTHWNWSRERSCGLEGERVECEDRPGRARGYSCTKHLPGPCGGLDWIDYADSG